MSGPTDPRVRKQENTALPSGCGLTGTPLRVSLSGLGGRECSACGHSVDGGEVGLHTPLLVELQLFVSVIRAAYFSAAMRDCTNRSYLPTCKAKAND